MTHPEPPSPADSHRRSLARFARWLSALEDFPTHREAAVSLARRLDAGGMSRAETLATLDSLDALLSEVWDRRPDEDE